MRRMLLILALPLFALVTPSESQDKKPCIGPGCKSSKPLSSQEKQSSVQVVLKVTDKTGSTPKLSTSRPLVPRLQWGEIHMTASVSGLPANSPPPLYQFAIRGWNAETDSYHGNQPVAASGEPTPNSQWSWTPDPYPNSLPGWDAKFIVTMQLALPEGTVIKTAEVGPYLFVDDERARWLWSTYIGPVITFHRCVNCHNPGDSPTQGDDRHIHVPPVNRQTTDCRQCHGETNGPSPGTPPGAPGHWRMPPPALAFAGKSAAQICRQIKDPAQNGGRTLEEVRKHVREDNIIRWAWDPGPGRTPAPFSWDGIAFAGNGAFNVWYRAGAACPDESPSAKTQGQGCCVIMANSSLKGRFGRLIVAYPSAAVPTGTRIAVFKDGREVQADYGNHEFELLSGTYEIKIGGMTVHNVTVKAGHDTKVKVGVLRITGANNKRAAVLESGKEIAGAYGGELIGLPAGTFDVQMAGQTERVTISEGKITDF